jgi:hypothetical protein
VQVVVKGGWHWRKAMKRSLTLLSGFILVTACGGGGDHECNAEGDQISITENRYVNSRLRP